MHQLSYCFCVLASGERKTVLRRILSTIGHSNNYREPRCIYPTLQVLFVHVGQTVKKCETKCEQCETYWVVFNEQQDRCAVTDLRIGKIGHGLGPRATPSYDDSST